ncbi:MAG: dUTP diphosphatase [Propionibacteriaceae bacterium]|jgi:dUTP pyrophosphatase|nr:dUTP diphosphatase [Propionibacteriaceae bacterium]
MAAETVQVRLKRLDDGLPLPRYAREHDAGADLAAAIDIVIPPGQRAMVPTGIAIEIPPGWVALVHPRSGLAAKKGLSIVNAPGTIDAGYRGQVQVCLLNTDLSEPIHIKRGDFIAQLVLQRVAQAQFVEVDELSESERGADGYGSTG